LTSREVLRRGKEVPQDELDELLARLAGVQSALDRRPSAPDRGITDDERADCRVAGVETPVEESSP